MISPPPFPLFLTFAGAAALHVLMFRSFLLSRETVHLPTFFLHCSPLPKTHISNLKNIFPQSFLHMSSGPQLFQSYPSLLCQHYRNTYLGVLNEMLLKYIYELKKKNLKKSLMYHFSMSFKEGERLTSCPNLFQNQGQYRNERKH